MKFQFAGFLLIGLTFTFTVGCGGSSSGGEGASAQANLRTAELPADALLDQMGPTSSFTTTRDLYVAGGLNFVTDIIEDNSKVASCVLNLPQSARAVSAYWIPAGTSYPIVKTKIGEDRSIALATEEGDPFDVPRLSCWTLVGDIQPLTVQFLRDAIAPSFTVDARQ